MSTGAGRVAQWVKGTSADPENLILILRTHSVKGQNCLHKLSSDRYVNDKLCT